MEQTTAETIRHEAVQAWRESSVESRDEGPLQPKGKGRDPGEWGNELDNNELDTALQQAALESYKEQVSEYASEKVTKHDDVRESAQRRTRPPETRPVAQIAPDSFLGEEPGKTGRRLLVGPDLKQLLIEWEWSGRKSGRHLVV